MIEFSCHTWGFNDLTLAESLGTIARLGFRWVDIGSGPGFDAPRASANPRRVAAEVNEDLLVYNLRASDLYLMLPRITDAERVEREVELFKALLPFAVELKTPGITISPGIRPADDPDAGRARATDALREMQAAAAENDLKLSIELHIDSIAQTPDEARALLREVPGLAITLDWAHLVYQGVSHDAILSLLPHTRHIHIRQAAKGQLQAAFERGRIDLERVVTDLKANGYDGIICTETMNMRGRGIAAVDALRENARLRDALRAARDKTA